MQQKEICYYKTSSLTKYLLFPKYRRYLNILSAADYVYVPVRINVIIIRAENATVRIGRCGNNFHYEDKSQAQK